MTLGAGLDSIRGRLTAITLCFVVCASAVMGGVGFNLMVNFERAQFRDHFRLLASYLASNAELGVLLDNQKMLSELTRNMLAVRDVQGVEVLNREGAVLVRMARGEVRGELGYVSAPVVSDPMGQSDSPFLAPAGAPQVVGRVNLSFSYAGLSRLKRLLAWRFSLVALALALVSVGMYWAMSRAIISPLRGLLAVAGEVSRGRMSVRAAGGSLVEISTLALAFNEMLDTLEEQRVKLGAAHEAMARQQALAEVGKFSMIVAHEIKNPLAIIKGSVDVLRREGLSEAGVKGQLLGFLDEEIERINKLIEDFLLFARPQAPALRPLALKELADSLSRRLALMPGGEAVSLRLDPEVARESLACDCQLMERALLNVVRNALEALPPGGHGGVRVEFFRGEEGLMIRIEDDGPGVASEHLARIFEPFYSGKAKGTGLGLSIVRDIVAAHRGEVEAANRPGGGACFTILLPLLKG